MCSFSVDIGGGLIWGSLFTTSITERKEAENVSVFRLLTRTQVFENDKSGYNKKHYVFMQEHIHNVKTDFIVKF